MDATILWYVQDNWPRVCDERSAISVKHSHGIHLLETHTRVHCPRHPLGENTLLADGYCSDLRIVTVNTVNTVWNLSDFFVLNLYYILLVAS